MDGFEKIELDGEPKKDRRFLSPKKISIALILLTVIVLSLTLSIFYIVFPAQKAYQKAMKTVDQAKKVWDAVKQQNVEVAIQENDKTKKALQETKDSLKPLAFIRLIPVLNNYYNDADHLAYAGEHGLNAASILLDSLKPYIDILGLKGQGSFVMGSAEERIKTAILTMGKITPNIDKIADYLQSARKEIDFIDPNRYPETFGSKKVRSQLIKLKKLADEGIIMVDQARPLIKVVPQLLGESKERRYLVLFQNDKELRPTGGFITAYSIFRIDKGIIHVDRSGDIYDLDNFITGKAKAPSPILKYLPKVYTFNLRDSNLSPDFVESMKTFNSLYEKIPGYTKVDGIIALDTHVLVSTIKILDDEVYAAGIRFTTKNDDRCSCPQVIYELEDQISRPVGYAKGSRKDLLGALLYAIMEKALKSSPKVYWGPLFQDTLTKISEKHVLLYLYNKDAQIGVEALNGAGRIKPFDGDYLHINESNFGGAKSNLFVKESVDVDFDVTIDGTINKKLTINYTNPYPPSDCNLERGNLCLNAILRDWIRIYVPKGSKLIDSKGSEVKISSYEDLGKSVFEGFLTVRPKGKATFSISYSLPFKLKQSSPLPILIQKQPGTDNNSYTINVKGKKVEEWPLLTDREIRIKL